MTSHVLHVWLWQTALSICRWEEATAVSVLETQSHRTSQSESFQHHSCPCAAESSVEVPEKLLQKNSHWLYTTVFIQQHFIWSLKLFNATRLSLSEWLSIFSASSSQACRLATELLYFSQLQITSSSMLRTLRPPLIGSSTALWHRSETYSPLLPPQLMANHIMSNRVLHTKNKCISQSDFWSAQDTQINPQSLKWGAQFWWLDYQLLLRELKEG